MMTVESRSSFPFEAPPPAGPVRIMANRNQLNARFQVLGFTVHSGGRPFFEVILATDRRLFDPANAGQRSASNFYESRRDNNLIRAENDGALFVVPASVVRAFAAHGSEIFYTAAGYDSEQGTNPVYAQPLAQLVAGAPSVAIAEDMRTKTMSAVLSVSLDRLLRVRDGDTRPAYAHNAYAAGLDARAIDAGDDRVEGEDGYESGGQALDYDDGYENGNGYEARGLADPGDAAVSFGDDDADELTPEERADAEPVAASKGAAYGMAYGTASAPAYGSRGGDEYDDGFGSPVAATAQDSRYPAGASAPDPLEDEDEGERYDGAATGASAEDDTISVAESYDDDFDGDNADLDYQPLSASAAPSAAAQPLTPQEQRRIIEAVAQFHSGRQRFAAMQRNEGRTAGGCPIGLAWGHLLFTQESGALGELLKTMNDRDAAAFASTFGPQWNELLSVTRNPSAGPNGCSSRVQPVAGADLWSDAWKPRFDAAASLPQFQSAQNETAAQLYLQPLLSFASALGLQHARALAILLDRRVEMGEDAAVQWITGAASPLQTSPQRQQALAELGYADVSALQRAKNLPATGTWDPATHGAALQALRARGRSPVPLPDPAEVVNRLVRRAEGTPWQQRTQSLAQLPDIVYAF
jgi:hypothetical protein